jgi:hypothetical protein
MQLTSPIAGKRLRAPFILWLAQMKTLLLLVFFCVRVRVLVCFADPARDAEPAVALPTDAEVKVMIRTVLDQFASGKGGGPEAKQAVAGLVDFTAASVRPNHSRLLQKMFAGYRRCADSPPPTDDGFWDCLVSESFMLFTGAGVLSDTFRAHAKEFLIQDICALVQPPDASLPDPVGPMALALVASYGAILASFLRTDAGKAEWADIDAALFDGADFGEHTPVDKWAEGALMTRLENMRLGIPSDEGTDEYVAMMTDEQVLFRSNVLLTACEAGQTTNLTCSQATATLAKFVDVISSAASPSLMLMELLADTDTGMDNPGQCDLKRIMASALVRVTAAAMLSDEFRGKSSQFDLKRVAALVKSDATTTPKFEAVMLYLATVLSVCMRDPAVAAVLPEVENKVYRMAPMHGIELGFYANRQPMVDHLIAQAEPLGCNVLNALVYKYGCPQPNPRSLLLMQDVFQIANDCSPVRRCFERHGIALLTSEEVEAMGMIDHRPRFLLMAVALLEMFCVPRGRVFIDAINAACTISF